MKLKIFYFIVILIGAPLVVFGLLGPGGDWGGILQPGIFYLDDTTIKTSDSAWDVDLGSGDLTTTGDITAASSTLSGNIDVSTITFDSASDGTLTITGGDLSTTGTGTFDKLDLTSTTTYDGITTHNAEFTIQNLKDAVATGFSFAANTGDIAFFAIYADGNAGSRAPYLYWEADVAGRVSMQSDVAIDFMPSDDNTDYIRFQTVANVPEITTLGACDLKITASGGDISFDNENLTTTGTGTFGRLEIDSPTFVVSAELYEGYVGIGTVEPAQKLDVVGSVKISANLTDGTNTLTIANAKSAYDHITSTGASHSWINQNVNIGANVTFGDIIGEDIIGDTITLSNAEGLSVISEHTSSQTNTVRYPFLINHKTSGDIANGFGVGMAFQIEDAGLPIGSVLAFIDAVRDGADSEGKLQFKAGTGGEEIFMTIAADGTVDVANILTVPLIETVGTTDTLSIQPDAIDTTVAVQLFENVATTDRPKLRVWGYNDYRGGQTYGEMYVDYYGYLTFGGGGTNFIGTQFTSDLIVGGNNTYLKFPGSGRYGLGHSAYNKHGEAAGYSAMLYLSSYSAAGIRQSAELIIGKHKTQDYDHPYTANPIVYFQSETAPDTDNTQWLSIQHDTTNGVIDVGSGVLSIPDAMKIGDGGTTNYMEISPTGDVVFVGSGGLAFGEIYANDVLDELTITTAGQANKVQITSFAVDGESNNATSDHTNDHITITKAGKYMVNVSMSISSAAAGGADDIGFAVYKNNGATEFPNLHGHRTLGGGGTDRGSCSMSGIIDLAVDDTIEVWAWNEDSTDNVVIDDITLSIMQIGG